VIVSSLLRKIRKRRNRLREESLNEDKKQVTGEAGIPGIQTFFLFLMYCKVKRANHERNRPNQKISLARENVALQRIKERMTDMVSLFPEFPEQTWKR
jgi:hypothetical protein